MPENILAEAQRESAGASTFGKYNFQYHWALCKVIEKHKSNEEYALLIEYHEDVIIANSLSGQEALFEFYQVKNQSALFTEHSLTKREKGKKDTLKSSVLGKLLSSCIGTQYENRITQIGLVSSRGFSLKTEKNLKLDIIKVGDLNEDCLKNLTNQINNELGISILPSHLQFIVPEIQLENQEDYVLAQFAKLVNTIFPGAQCNAVDIYRAIIDEMGRKGRIQLDYKEWDRLISKKSLTSIEVNNVLALNTTRPKITQLENDFNDLVSNFGWRPLSIRSLRSKLKTLALKRSGFPTSYDINIISVIKSSIKKVDYNSFSSDLDYVNALFHQAIVDNLDKMITDSDDLKVEIFYALLVDES
jgi:hypothetical protein